MVRRGALRFKSCPSRVYVRVCVFIVFSQVCNRACRAKYVANI